MVEVSTIAQAYRQSYQFSQESYEDGFVRVIGIVGEIHIEEATSVVLMSSDGRYAVNCKLSEDAKECVSAIAVGKRISIIGRCRGLENSKVVFDESLILGNEAGGS